jgi:hypothetical protein
VSEIQDEIDKMRDALRATRAYEPYYLCIPEDKWEKFLKDAGIDISTNDAADALAAGSFRGSRVLRDYPHRGWIAIEVT